MRILSENSILKTHSPTSVRRIFSITAGLIFGLVLSLSSLHSKRPTASVLSEAGPGGKLSVSSKTSSSSTHRKPLDWHQIGLASWYGPRFQGKETANGETFNMYNLTCAHRSLPLGTWLKVTNLHTHRWIVVRVNDRGPVPDTRIVDLSSEAARMLGMRERGVTRIRLDVIDPKQSVEIARLDKLRLARLAAAQQLPTDSGE
ncbi:MAG: septal ring lytic transglycosylase RlpA family protein [Acidobacteriaceae bacterium]